jgi:hypothetical protein
LAWSTAAIDGIHAPLSTGSLYSLLTVGSIVSKRMPRYGRASGFPALACARSGLAMSMGMAKPMFCAWLAAAVLMPMTLPVGSSSGPPLLPGLIAVSVWIRFDRVEPSSTGMLRPRAETMPLVTESVNVPSGLPIAMACWPTWMFDESPIGAVGRPVASILTIARSVRVSMP